MRRGGQEHLRPQVGVAILVSWEHFGVAAARLRATARDSALLAATLGSRGFRVHVLRDPPRDQLLVARETPWGGVRQLLLAASSHGDSRARFYPGDLGEPMHLQQLWQPFISVPQLQGNLKIFIMDMCRGGRLDVVESATAVSDRSAALRVERVERIPNCADSLLISSSAELFQSFASGSDDEGGSFLTERLCARLRRRPGQDLISLLRDVTRDVLRDVQTRDSRRRLISQTTSVVSFLTRTAYLGEVREESATPCVSEQPRYPWEPRTSSCLVLHVQSPWGEARAHELVNTCSLLGLRTRAVSVPRDQRAGRYLPYLEKVCSMTRRSVSGLVVFLVGLETERTVHEARSSRLQQRFGATAWPALRGKPKIFFFIHETPRGECSVGVEEGEPTVAEATARYHLRSGRVECTHTNPALDIVSQNSDFLICCGTGQGYVKVLCQHLRLRAESSEEEEMTTTLTKIHREIVNNEECGELPPHFETTLLKYLYW